MGDILVKKFMNYAQVKCGPRIIQFLFNSFEKNAMRVDF